MLVGIGEFCTPLIPLRHCKMQFAPTVNTLNSLGPFQGSPLTLVLVKLDAKSSLYKKDIWGTLRSPYVTLHTSLVHCETWVSHLVEVREGIRHPDTPSFLRRLL